MRTILALVILAAMLAACGGGDDDDAGGGDAESAMEEYVGMALKQQGGPAYDRIVPEQAALIDRELFISCLQDGSGVDADVEATESYTETIDVPEVGEVETWAVTVELSRGEQSTTATRHLIERDGEFYTFFDQASLDSYAAGECP